MAKVSPTNPPLFEHTTCGRCGGSGSYSFNLMSGSRCFGCGGSGFKLTKRGRAAQNWLDERKTKPVSELKVGDVYYSRGFSAGSFTEPNRWVVIDAIEQNADGTFKISGHDKHRVGQPFSEVGYSNASGSDLWRVAQTNERLAELRKAALEFQATLGKNGQPLKAKAAKATA